MSEPCNCLCFWKEHHPECTWRASERNKPSQDVALELAACREAAVYLFNCGYMRGHHDTVEACFVDIHDSDMRTYQSDVVAEVIDEALTVRKGEGEA